MAFGFSTPGYSGGQNAGFSGSWQAPNTLINAMMKTPDDYHSTQSYSQSGPWGGNMIGGSDATSGGAGGGGGGGGGGAGQTSSSASNAWGTTGQAEKISGLGQDAAAAINQAGQNYRFGAVMPSIMGAFGSAGGAGGSAIGKQTAITQSPIWTQQQINQQVNNQQAQNNAQMGTQNKMAAQSLAGRGMGANSPLLSALQGQNQMQNLMANQSANQQTNWNAAQGNAQQVLAEQTQAEQNWYQMQQQDIARRQVGSSLQGALGAALAGLGH